MIDATLLSKMHPELRERAIQWVSAAQSAGLVFRVYCTERSAAEQALLYRRGRTWEAVASEIARLQGLGMGDMANVLREAPSQPGPDKARIVTKAGPGLSFHQRQFWGGEWGALAFDFVPLLGGKAMWEDAVSYLAGGELAEGLGLTWSGRWGWESAHVQFDDGGTLKMPQLAIETSRARGVG
jgi:peptidoglycan L-alanyl-D-glutamate endopeptidase CwlK